MAEFELENTRFFPGYMSHNGGGVGLVYFSACDNDKKYVLN